MKQLNESNITQEDTLGNTKLSKSKVITDVKNQVNIINQKEADLVQSILKNKTWTRKEVVFLFDYIVNDKQLEIDNRLFKNIVLSYYKNNKKLHNILKASNAENIRTVIQEVGIKKTDDLIKFQYVLDAKNPTELKEKVNILQDIGINKTHEIIAFEYILDLVSVENLKEMITILKDAGINSKSDFLKLSSVLANSRVQNLRIVITNLGIKTVNQLLGLKNVMTSSDHENLKTIINDAQIRDSNDLNDLLNVLMYSNSNNLKILVKEFGITKAKDLKELSNILANIDSFSLRKKETVEIFKKIVLEKKYFHINLSKLNNITPVFSKKLIDIGTCSDAEMYNVDTFFEEKITCNFIFVNGVLIGHVKDRGESTFLSYINFKGLKKGGIYTLKGGNHLSIGFNAIENIEVKFLRNSDFSEKELDIGISNMYRKSKRYKLELFNYFVHKSLRENKEVGFFD
ncbi:MAG: hypothetical protein PHN31_01490 [Candidatus Gracilibacteria bacterium]|nr:hypothetical protein [Candidatus Gracilibacteria bacterium]